MAVVPETVLVVRPDGTAASVDWPGTDDERRAVVVAEVGALTKMRRCGKGILGFLVDTTAPGPAAPRSEVDRPTATPVDDARRLDSTVGPADAAVNRFAAAAFAEQGVVLEDDLRGPVLFARNPSKGSVVKALTAAQSANLLVVTGARLG